MSEQSGAPVCLGPGGDIAAEHQATEMESAAYDDDAWQCPNCKVIVRA